MQSKTSQEQKLKKIIKETTGENLNETLQNKLATILEEHSDSKIQEVSKDTVKEWLDNDPLVHEVLMARCLPSIAKELRARAFNEVNAHPRIEITYKTPGCVTRKKIDDNVMRYLYTPDPKHDNEDIEEAIKKVKQLLQKKTAMVESEAIEKVAQEKRYNRYHLWQWYFYNTAYKQEVNKPKEITLPPQSQKKVK